MNFRKWCNDYQGVFAFIALIIAFIPVIVQFKDIPISLKNGVLSLLSIFLLKIYIPIYLVIVFGFIFFFLAYKYLLSHKAKNNFSFNKLHINQSNSDLIIQSDENTTFVESETYKDLPKNVKSFEFSYPVWLSHSNQLPILDGAKWISHSKNITNQEAIDGGLYKFKKAFDLDFKTKQIQSAYLYLLVDDFCTVYLNGNLVEADNGETRVIGYTELKKYDISSFLIFGQNEILFHVENINFHQENLPGKPFYLAQDKGQLNPYGIIYTIKIEK